MSASEKIDNTEPKNGENGTINAVPLRRRHVPLSAPLEAASTLKYRPVSMPWSFSYPGGRNRCALVTGHEHTRWKDGIVDPAHFAISLRSMKGCGGAQVHLKPKRTS